MVLHADLMHLAINMLFLLAFGSGVARQIGAARFLLFYALTGMAGGITFMLIEPQSTAVLIGASGAVSGLMGAVVHMVFRRPVRRPGNGRQALIFIAVWLAMNWLVGSYGADAIGASGPIAWQAHMGGFLVGLALFPLLRYPYKGFLPRSGG
jgi:membrane associated rhomboid family serine protease